jgi:hypothetical protein
VLNSIANDPHCLRAGLVRAMRIKQWTFYKLDETSIKKVKRMIVEHA